jgi:preprotein translocase SecE subunit
MAKEKKVKKEKVKKETFLRSVREEMKKVKFASFKETMKYFFTTVVLILFIVGFFMLITLLASWIKGMFI